MIIIIFVLSDFEKFLKSSLEVVENNRTKRKSDNDKIEIFQLQNDRVNARDLHNSRCV